MMVEALVAALRAAGVQPDLPELKEALWLANFLPTGEPAEPVSETPRDETPRNLSADLDLFAAALSSGSPRPERMRPTEPEPQNPRFPYATSKPTATADIPATRALDDPLALARSFRPIKRHTAPGPTDEVDETATADFVADTRIWLPVLRPVPERSLRLTFLVDVGRSMPIWQPTVDEFIALASNTGAFRDVRRLNFDPESPDEVSFAPGRQLILALTDGVGTAWRDGRAHALLHRIAGTATVAVVSVLPPRMWPGTGLHTVSTVLQPPAAGAPNENWTTDSSSIPVVEIAPSSLSRLFTMVSGDTSWSEFDTLPPPESASAAPPRTSGDARAAVGRFLAGATPAAQRLASCLAAAAPLTLEVMHLIRTIMLPEAGTAHLAEVVLGGLLEYDPATASYDFIPGLRVVLLERLTRTEAIEVADHITAYASARTGHPARFSLLLADPDAADVDAYREIPLVAQVSAQILNLLGPRYRELANRLSPAPKRVNPEPDPRPTAFRLSADVPAPEPRRWGHESGEASADAAGLLAQAEGDTGISPGPNESRGEPADADLRTKVTDAWQGFARSLAEILAGLDAGVHIDLALDPTASSTNAAAYSVRIQVLPGGVIEALAVGNAELPEGFRMDREAVASLVVLGWSPPGVLPGSGDSFGLRSSVGKARQLATVITRTFRDIYGAPHPAFLVYFVHDEQGDPIETAPLATAHYEPRVGGELTETLEAAAQEAVPLEERVRSVVATMSKTTVDQLQVDTDGDIGIRAGSAMVFVRVRDNPSLVDVFSPILTEVEPTGQLYVKLSELTNRLPIGRLYCAQDTVWASIPVFGRNFQATHLMLAVQVMTGLADELDDRLHSEFGGKRFFGDGSATRMSPSGGSERGFD